MPAFFSRRWIKRLLSNMSLHTFRIMSANIHKNLRFLCHQLPKMHNLSTLCSLFQLLPLKTWNFFVTFAFCIRYIVLPYRAYPDRDTMSEMRYANTKILIVTRYPLLVGILLACWARFRSCLWLSNIKIMRLLCVSSRVEYRQLIVSIA